MNQKELRELIEFLVEKDIAEFEMERGDLKLHIKRGAGAAPVIAPPVVVACRAGRAHPRAVIAPPPQRAAHRVAAAPAAPAAAPSDDADLHILKSPMVGTYLWSSFARCAAVYRSRRHGQRRPGAVHH